MSVNHHKTCNAMLSLEKYVIPKDLVIIKLLFLIFFATDSFVGSAQARTFIDCQTVDNIINRNPNKFTKISNNAYEYKPHGYVLLTIINTCCKHRTFWSIVDSSGKAILKNITHMYLESSDKIDNLSNNYYATTMIVHTNLFNNNYIISIRYNDEDIVKNITSHTSADGSTCAPKDE